MGHRYELNRTTGSGIREAFRGSRYLRPHGETWTASEYHFHTPTNNRAPDALTPCGCMVWRNTEGNTVRCALLNKQDLDASDLPACNPAVCALMTAHRMWADDEPRAPRVILRNLRARGMYVYPYRSLYESALYGAVLTVDPGDGTRLQVSQLGDLYAVVSHTLGTPLVEWTEDRF